MNNPLRVIARILVALSPLVFVAINLNPYMVRFLPIPSIESYLLWKTPVGASQDEVMDYLRSTEALRQVQAASPLAADGRIDFVMGEPGAIVGTTVAGSYAFGPDGRLLGIDIRKSGDAR